MSVLYRQAFAESKCIVSPMPCPRQPTAAGIAASPTYTPLLLSGSFFLVLACAGRDVTVGEERVSFPPAQDMNRIAVPETYKQIF